MDDRQQAIEQLSKHYLEHCYLREFTAEVARIVVGDTDSADTAGYVFVSNVLAEVIEGKLFGPPEKYNYWDKIEQVYQDFVGEGLPLPPFKVHRLSHLLLKVLPPLMHQPFAEWMYRLCSIKGACPLVPNRAWLLSDPGKE